MTHDRNPRDDSGVTLVELVISVALMAMLASVVSGAIIVMLRTSPGVADRADAAVNVQGLVTWLPQDVDSAEPDSFDTNQATMSGCAGVDPGFNLFKVTWSETITSTVDYAASYRYVAEAGGGSIFRVYCVVGETPLVAKVTGLIPPWVAGSEPVRVTLGDLVAPFDGEVDSAKFMVEPIVGKTIVIDSTTKNPNETLTTTPPTTTPTTTAPPPPPNQPPTVANVSATVKSGTAVSVGLPVSDPEGAAVTVSVAAVPADWTITPGPGASLVVTAPAAADGTTQVVTYTATDPLGGSASAQLTISVVAPSVNQPPQASPATVSVGAGNAITFGLPATDPESGALTATFSGVPAGWTATAVGLAATITPPSNTALGNYTVGYTATDPGGLASSSTITVTVTGPPPCVIATPVLSQPSVALKKNNPDAISKDIQVSITILSGYCVGLSLNYDTGAPNGQYVRNFGGSGTTRTITLQGHPSPELWSAGTKALSVKDGSSSVIGTVNLQVTR